MARRSKLTPQTQKRILDAIKLGATYELAAKYGGISYETFNEWRKGKPAFSEALAQAEGDGALIWLAKIEKAASDGDWRAAAWKMERRYPDTYGRTVSEQQHSGGLEVRVAYVNDWRGGSAADGATTALPGLEGLTLPAEPGENSEVGE